jgi:hypothetical protein
MCIIGSRRRALTAAVEDHLELTPLLLQMAAEAREGIYSLPSVNNGKSIPKDVKMHTCLRAPILQVEGAAIIVSCVCDLLH